MTNAALEKFVRDRIEAPKRFFNSTEFKSLINAFKDAAQNGTISQEKMLHSDHSYPFTEEQFRKAFEAVMQCAPGEETPQILGHFHCTSKVYEGLEFSIMFGQGSSYSIMQAKPA